MRTDGICRVYDLDSHRTERLYVPTNVLVEQMTLAQLMPGLCHMADTKGEKCRTCKGCRYGKRLVQLADAGELRMPPEPEKQVVKRPIGKLTGPQLARLERMRQERRRRVATAQALMAAGTCEMVAAMRVGYGSVNAYRKAAYKCEVEARKGENHA